MYSFESKSELLGKDEIPNVPNCQECGSPGINIDQGVYFLNEQKKECNMPNFESGIPLICTFCRKCGLVRFYKRNKE